MNKKLIIIWPMIFREFDFYRLEISKISKYFEEEEFKNDKVLNYLYRPFEIKKIYFEPKYLGRSREKIMQHYKKKNVGLIISKQFGGHKQFILFITKVIVRLQAE